MTSNVNLLKLVVHAKLPLDGLPEDSNHKSHRNKLSVPSHSWRRLETIYHINPNALSHQVSTWIGQHLRHKYLKADSKITLLTERDEYVLEEDITDMNSLASVIDQLLLQTAQAIVHASFPQCLKWNFKRNDQYQRDHEIFDYFLWSTNPEDATEAGYDEERRTSILVAFQPPDILSKADIDAFVKMQTYPPYVKQGFAYPTVLNSSQRLWAKLWDTCVKHDTHWFVLTSYKHWVFGAFSPGWCRAFVSDGIQYRESNPGVLQYIVYWMASAAACDNGYRIPKVPEPIDTFRTEIKMPQFQDSTPLPVSVISESDWEGKSREATTSAHMTCWSGQISCGGLDDYIPTPLERQRPEKTGFIRKWQKAVVRGGMSTIDETKEESNSEDNSDTDIVQGEWLV